MEPQLGQPTAVTIFGRTYHLRGANDSGYLVELASIVDERMRAVSEGTGTADTLKVAILAALNLADDYLEASRKPAKPATEKRLARLVTLLDEALVG